MSEFMQCVVYPLLYLVGMFGTVFGLAMWRARTDRAYKRRILDPWLERSGIDPDEFWRLVPMW